MEFSDLCGHNYKFMNKSQKMTQRERIAWYVLRGELIDSESLYAAFRALGGNRNVRGRAAKAEWLVVPHTLFC